MPTSATGFEPKVDFLLLLLYLNIKVNIQKIPESSNNTCVLNWVIVLL